MSDNQTTPTTPAPTVSDNNSKDQKVSKWLSIISAVLQAVAGIFSRSK